MHHGPMSTDSGPHAGSSWRLVEQGSFVLGRCEVCGFRSAARRARFSAESDMRAHELLCPAATDLAGHAPDTEPLPSVPTATVPADASASGPETPSADDRLAEEVASGRERLSAQGRS